MSRKRAAVPPAAPPAALDACCLIDLLVTGCARDILQAAGYSRQLPAAVQGEVQYVRQHDPAQPGAVVKEPADLTALIASGLLTVCSPQGQHEADRFTHYATLFRSDGESMCLALAESRGWVVATDDKRALRVARQAGLAVVSCPGLLKRWADATAPDQATLQKALLDIQILAQFQPTPTMPEYAWWVQVLTGAAP